MDEGGEYQRQAREGRKEGCMTWKGKAQEACKSVSIS